MSKLKLSDVEWKEFFIGGNNGILVVSGSKTTHPSQLKMKGRTPRITCSASNNGLDDTYANHATEQGGVLAVDSATVGFVSYQGVNFIATDHVEKISLPNGKAMSKEVGLFLKTSIESATKNKYGYGYKFSQTRINKQIIMLPVDLKGKPNWKFMEEYIKQEMKVQTQKVIDYYKNKALDTRGGEPSKLSDVKWEVFSFDEICKIIQRGKRLTKANQIKGSVPYVSSTKLNNGVDNFISNEKDVRGFKKCLTLANSGSVGSCFYQDYEFIASDHVTALISEEEHKYIYLFIASIIKRLEEKYSFNREINDKRIRREKILLPVDKNNKINFQYMKRFTEKMKKDNVGVVLGYYKEKLKTM